MVDMVDMDKQGLGPRGSSVDYILSFFQSVFVVVVVVVVVFQQSDRRRGWSLLSTHLLLFQ